MLWRTAGRATIAAIRWCMPSVTAWPLAVLLLGTGAAPPAPPPAPTAIKVTSISFLSGHRVLSDYTDSYRRGGELIAAPEWTPSRNLPVTQTGGTRLELAVVLQASSLVPKEAVKVVARARGSRVTEELLVGIGVHRGGTITVRLRSTGGLPKAIYKETLMLEWLVDAGQGLVPAGATGPHVLYVTLAEPTSERDRNEDIVHRYPSPPPSGVTIKRMEAAMALIAKAKAEDATDTHALVAKLMELFPEFSLAKGSHYVNDHGGAWALADAVAESGECQAIVRLVKAVLGMVGAPGQLALVKLYADPDHPTVPIELPWGAEQAPPPKKQMKLVSTEGERRGWAVGLLTEKPAFPDEEEAKPEYGPCWKVGPITAATGRPRFLTEKPNSFEGALKVTAQGITRYYGGGLGGTPFATKEELFASAFWGMVWTMLAPVPKPERQAWDEQTTAVMKRVGVAAQAPARKSGGEGFRMMEIIHIYDEDRCR